MPRHRNPTERRMTMEIRARARGTSLTVEMLDEARRSMSNFATLIEPALEQVFNDSFRELTQAYGRIFGLDVEGHINDAMRYGTAMYAINRGDLLVKSNVAEPIPDEVHVHDSGEE